MLTNLKIPTKMDLSRVPPLDETEVDERMRHFEQLLNELEWKRVKYLALEMEAEMNKIKLETQEKLAAIEEDFLKQEYQLKRRTALEISNINTRNRLEILSEMDKHVTDVIMAVHHRLGRIDHHEHKRAYKRILFALIVQALCRLMEPEAVVVFRVADVAIGKRVFEPAKAKYKEITGLDVVLGVDGVNFLPLESCGGVNVTSVNGERTVSNTLVDRLDNLLQKINPVIRIVLYGVNENRQYYDLSEMCGSPSLFSFARPLSPATVAALAKLARLTVRQSASGRRRSEDEPSSSANIEPLSSDVSSEPAPQHSPDVRLSLRKRRHSVRFAIPHNVRR